MVEFCPSVRLTYSTAMGQSGLFMRVNAERRSFCSVNHLGGFSASFHFGIYLWQNSHGPHDPSCVTTFMFFCYLFIYFFLTTSISILHRKKGIQWKIWRYIMDIENVPAVIMVVYWSSGAAVTAVIRLTLRVIAHFMKLLGSKTLCSVLTRSV